MIFCGWFSCWDYFCDEQSNQIFTCNLLPIKEMNEHIFDCVIKTIDDDCIAYL